MQYRLVFLKEAEKAKAALDGKKALGKKIVVDWARFDPASKTNVRPFRVLCITHTAIHLTGGLCIRDLGSQSCV